MSFFTEVKLNPDNAAFDAFNRLRVSRENARFDSQFTYGLKPMLWEQLTAGGGAISHDTTNMMAAIDITAGAVGSFAYLQTFEHFRYTSGRSQYILASFIFGAAVTDVLKYVGYTDRGADGVERNGIEFQMLGTGVLQFALYSNTSLGDSTVAQTSWNLDTLDGNGPSGVTLDVTKTNILVMDFQALYSGRVRIGFDIDGEVIWAHQFLNANISSYPYIQSANLPVSAGLISSHAADTVTASMNLICSTVMSEGGDVNEGYYLSVEGVGNAASGARTHLLSLQHRPLFRGFTNRVKFILENMNLIVTGSFPIKWELVVGQALTGDSFADVNTTHSAMEYDDTGVVSGDPTLVIASGYVDSSRQSSGAIALPVPFKYPICLDAAGADRLDGRLSVLVTGLGGAPDCRVSINWKEIR